MSFAALARCSRGRSLGAAAGALLLAAFATGAFAAPASPSIKPPAVDFAPPPIDASFARGLPLVKAAAGLIETNSAAVLGKWTPGLCMLIGFRTDIGSKQFVHLVEVTTLDPLTKDARGRTNVPPPIIHFMKFTGTNQLQPRPRTHVFRTVGYPVRVRLRNAEGKLLKESREFLPWEFLTNGLVDVCSAIRAAGRLSATNGILTLAGTTNDLTVEWLNALEIRAARGGLALGGLFGVIGDTDALEEVRSHAMSVVRPPNFLKALFELKLDIQLDPKFERAVELSPGGRMWFPLTLRQGERVLTQVEFVADSTEGAWFLTSGVRALRATHPVKTDRRMLAQVLAVGMVPVSSISDNPAEKH